MKPDRSLNQLNASRALEHLRAAVKYASRGKEVFFDSEVPDTSLLVEGELRKAFESLNRLGASFYQVNPKFDRERVGEVRQQLTHEYADVEREFLWRVVRDEVPVLIRLLTRSKVRK